MKALVREKEKAVQLRKKGYSYKEILAEVSVAKSSLSLWLKDTPLTIQEKAVLSDRKDKNISRGRIKAASANRTNRLDREKARLPVIEAEFKEYVAEPLFQLGLGLYWAEGAKNSGTVMFINSDVRMVEIMLQWFLRYTGNDRSSLRYRLYIHKLYANEDCEQWWAQKLEIPMSAFKKTTYKPTSRGVKKKLDYKGCLRVEVPKSTHLLHRLKVWTNFLVEYHSKQ